MQRTPLLCAFGVVVSWVAAAGSQQVPPVAVSRELRAHVQLEQFQVVTSLRGLPLGVRDALQALFGSGTLDIAEPGAEFQATDVKSRARLPLRRLLLAGCTYDHCLVYYERGGGTPVWRVVLFHWTPDETRIDWGGAAQGGLRTIDDVRGVVLSGAPRGRTEPW